MILRKLANAIRHQNWFTVILEVLIVVAGIFIGLQVDDWNQSRKDRQNEQLFFERLHEDILLAEQLSSRVRDRRLNRLEHAYTAAEVLFGRVDRASLTFDECDAIAALSYVNVNVVGLPALAELAGTGRMHIIRDDELRRALVSLVQVKETLRHLILVQSISGRNLGSAYPSLIRLESVYAEDMGEAGSNFECDVLEMRANTPFLNDFSIAVDMYDAYIRDGLRPWVEQFGIVHDLVDATLGITHD